MTTSQGLDQDQSWTWTDRRVNQIQGQTEVKGQHDALEQQKQNEFCPFYLLQVGSIPLKMSIKVSMPEWQR